MRQACDSRKNGDALAGTVAAPMEVTVEHIGESLGV